MTYDCAMWEYCVITHFEAIYIESRRDANVPATTPSPSERPARRLLCSWYGSSIRKITSWSEGSSSSSRIYQLKKTLHHFVSCYAAHAPSPSQCKCQSKRLHQKFALSKPKVFTACSHCRVNLLSKSLVTLVFWKIKLIKASVRAW